MKAHFVPFDRPRGQPLLVFAVVLGGWLVLRVLLWEPPFADLSPVRTLNKVLKERAANDRPRLRSAAALPMLPSLRGMPAGPQAVAERVLTQHFAAPSAAEGAGTLPRNSVGRASAHLQAGRAAEAPRVGLGSTAAASVPIEFGSSQQPLPSAASEPRVQRWSGDAWLLLRQDSAVPLAASRPAYGRSQAGAVLRYRLAPSSGHRPVLYARATRALAGAGEAELVAGFAARPLSGFPVSIAGEVRVYDSAPGARCGRPALPSPNCRR